MTPTAIAKRVFYTPPYNKENGGYTPPADREQIYDKYHVEMEEIINGSSWHSEAGSFNSKEEAEGFMAGWNAHRNTVSEKLFVSRVGRKR